MHTVDEMCRAGCTSRRGVRYWEDQDLLGPVARSEGGTRRYTAEQLDKARIIAAALGEIPIRSAASRYDTFPVA